MTCASTCRRGTGESFTSCVLRSIAVFSAARLALNTVKNGVNAPIKVNAPGH